MTISVVVCAHNEEAYLAPCLHSLLAQTRLPDEILVINNASTDRTRDVASAVSGVRVIDESRKGLVVARERGRQEARGDLLVYLDADSRAPLMWLERIERAFTRVPSLIALSASYRFYDWDRWGRALIRFFDTMCGSCSNISGRNSCLPRSTMSPQGQRAHHCGPRRLPPAVGGRLGGRQWLAPAGAESDRSMPGGGARQAGHCRQ